MGFRSLIISGVPKEEMEKGFEIIPKEKWSEIVEKDGMIFCKNDMNWKWYGSYDMVNRWNEFMSELEEKYEDEGFFTMVIGEDGGMDYDSSWNPFIGYDYGFGVEINEVGSIFK